MDKKEPAFWVKAFEFVTDRFTINPWTDLLLVYDNKKEYLLHVDTNNLEYETSSSLMHPTRGHVHIQ